MFLSALAHHAGIGRHRGLEDLRINRALAQTSVQAVHGVRGAGDALED
jgi:hypothetical protein